jgi:hypothetical protein
MAIMTTSTTLSEYPMDILLDSVGLNYADEENDSTSVLQVPERSAKPRSDALIIARASTAESLSRDVAYQVVTGANGHAMAVWRESDGVCYHMWANRYAPDVGWGTAIQIDGNNAEEIFAPKICMNSKGEAIVVWQQSGSTGNKLWTNRYETGKGWGTASLVTMHNVSDACAAQVAIDSAGNAIALWRQYNGNTTTIWLSRYVPYSGWSAAAPVSASCTGHAFDPQITMAPSGHAMVVWTQSSGRFSHIWAKRYIAYEGWGRAIQIDTASAGRAFFPQAAMDNSGNTVAAWHVFDGAKKSIWANDYSPDFGWREAKLIQAACVSWAFDPQASLNLAGSTAVLLRGYQSTQFA